jgi:hypothetical protein
LLEHPRLTTFYSSKWVRFAIDRVFAFFSNPENLPQIMPASRDQADSVQLDAYAGSAVGPDR